MDRKRLILEFPLSILINLAKIGTTLFPKLSVDLEILQIQKSDRTYSEMCPKFEIYKKPAKEETLQLLACIESFSDRNFML